MIHRRPGQTSSIPLLWSMSSGKPVPIHSLQGQSDKVWSAQCFVENIYMQEAKVAEVQATSINLSTKDQNCNTLWHTIIACSAASKYPWQIQLWALRSRHVETLAGTCFKTEPQRETVNNPTNPHLSPADVASYLANSHSMLKRYKATVVNHCKL